MGDVKMMAMIGAFLGLRGTFLTLLGREPSGKRDRYWPYRGVVLRGWRSGVAKRAEAAWDWGRSGNCDGRLRGDTSCPWARFWGLGAGDRVMGDR